MPGQEEDTGFFLHFKGIYRGAAVILFVFDLGSRPSFSKLSFGLEKLKE